MACIYVGVFVWLHIRFRTSDSILHYYFLRPSKCSLFTGLIQRLDFNTDVRNIIIINFPLVFAQENLYSNRNLFISLDVSSYKRKKKGLNCLKQLICAVANSIKRNHPLKSSAAPFQGSPNPSQKLSSFSFSFSPPHYRTHLLVRISSVSFCCADVDGFFSFLVWMQHYFYVQQKRLHNQEVSTQRAAIAFGLVANLFETLNFSFLCSSSKGQPIKQQPG